MPRKELTQQQENFCQLYIKYGIAPKAYKEAYPKAVNWKKSTLDSEASRMLNNPKISTRINELNEQKTSALMQSTKISHRKLLETALQTMLECNTPAERQHFVSLIKMLFQKEGLLSENNNNININVNNNTCINEVSNFLDL